MELNTRFKASLVGLEIELLSSSRGFDFAAEVDFSDDSRTG